LLLSGLLLALTAHILVPLCLTLHLALGPVCRYCVENSIEERMIALQEQKKDLISLAFDRRTPEEVRQSRLADVRMLMEIK
jgi:hypothetical protein